MSQSLRGKCRVVLVTCPNRRQARELANLMVKKRLAACVNLLPTVESVFWWEGKVDRSREALVLIKTTAARFEALRRAIQSQHPYDVPEIIALPIATGHRPYLTWIRESLRPAT